MGNDVNLLDEAQAVALIEKESLASVAACDGRRLDNAVICVANDGLYLYFGGLTTTLKGRLMLARSTVALTIGSMQYHGSARVLPHGSDDYLRARATYDRKFPQYAKLFELEDNELFELRPLALWLYDGVNGVLNRPFLVKDEGYFRSLDRDAPRDAGRDHPEGAREIDYLALEKEAIAFASSRLDAVLATESGGIVAARSMTILWSGLEAWLQTSVHSEKWTQISQNPNVAICAGNMQIEGKAERRGTAFEKGNEWFLERYPAVHAGSFERYGRLPEERVVLVHPTRVSFWKYIDGKPFRDHLDILRRKAWRSDMASN
ncbi:MAG: hypothetical protein Q8M76_00280 [Spirochaetaceae bacterium]|nr:hypothetical protein [Spirochaetaceae bacterium]